MAHGRIEAQESHVRYYVCGREGHRSKECDSPKGKYYENKMREAAGGIRKPRFRSPTVQRWPEVPRQEQAEQARERESAPHSCDPNTKQIVEKHKYKPKEGDATKEEIEELMRMRRESLRRQGKALVRGTEVIQRPAQAQELATSSMQAQRYV